MKCKKCYWYYQDESCRNVERKQECLNNKFCYFIETPITLNLSIEEFDIILDGLYHYQINISGMDGMDDLLKDIENLLKVLLKE